MVKIEQIQFAEPVFGDEERAAVNRVMQGKWLASAKENEAFEDEFAKYIGVPYAVCVNSGSSANLLALASLGLTRGDRVITSSCGFPATLSPILHLGLEPVLVDYDLKTHNIDVDDAIDAIKNSGAKAIIYAHTLGVPVDDRIIDEALSNDVRIVEDSCESLGAKIDGAQVGSDDIGTFSFYPSHQITALGGGGMVTCNDRHTFNRLRSLRDWGKMSNWDKYTQNNTSYDMDVDGIPYFPHYVYETVGFNMKLPEANAAFGREQLKRLDGFVAARKRIHDAIEAGVDHRYLVRHKVPVGAEPSWFGVVLTLTSGSRDKLGNHLETMGIRHRPFFAGNITRHPPFSKYKQDFPVADYLMKNSLFVGCWPGITDAEIEYMVTHINNGLYLAQQ